MNPPAALQVNERRRLLLKLSVLTGARTICGGGLAFALEPNRPAHFLPEERRLIEDYYRHGKNGKAKGLPPGLAKRGGNLPPGLQKHLEKNGQVPPGLQKRLPADLDSRLPRLPDSWERVVIERDVILSSTGAPTAFSISSKTSPPWPTVSNPNGAG